jgi:hypothetical protein
MLRVLPSPLYGVPHTGGQPSLKLLDVPVLPGGSISAPIVTVASADGKSTRTIFRPSFQLLVGTDSTDSLRGSIATPTEYKSCARNATAERPRRKIVSEERTQRLRNHLKGLLEEDKLSYAAKEIERLADNTFGDSHRFIYRDEAKVLSTVDLDKLDKFVAEVRRIRQDLDTDYYFATKALIGDDDASDNQ